MKTKCKNVFRPLKVRAKSMEEWLRYVTDFGSYLYNVMKIGQAIAKYFRSQNLWKIQSFVEIVAKPPQE